MRGPRNASVGKSKVGGCPRSIIGGKVTVMGEG